MKVVLIWSALFIACVVESYTFVISQETGTPRAVKNEAVTERVGQTMGELYTKTENVWKLRQMYLGQFKLSSKSRRSSLCIDESGKEVIGIIAYKADCRKFVQCGYGTENVIECQYGLLFNTLTKSCDWPHQANCVEFRGKDDRKLVIPAGDVIW